MAANGQGGPAGGSARAASPDRVEWYPGTVPIDAAHELAPGSPLSLQAGSELPHDADGVSVYLPGAPRDLRDAGWCGRRLRSTDIYAGR